MRDHARGAIDDGQQVIRRVEVGGRPASRYSRGYRVVHEEVVASADQATDRFAGSVRGEQVFVEARHPARSVLAGGNHRHECAIAEQSVVVGVRECDGGGSVRINGKAEAYDRLVRSAEDEQPCPLSRSYVT